MCQRLQVSIGLNISQCNILVFLFSPQSEIVTKSLLILQGAERLCNAKYVRIHQTAARVC